MLAMEDLPLFEYIGVGFCLTISPAALVVVEARHERWLALPDITHVTRGPEAGALTVQTVDGRCYTYHLPPRPLAAALDSLTQARAALASGSWGWAYAFG
jgi:hypothetical protein